MLQSMGLQRAGHNLVTEQQQQQQQHSTGFPGDSVVKNLPAMWETWFGTLDLEDPLEEDMATHSSILAWKIPMDRGVWRIIVHGVAKSQI